MKTFEEVSQMTNEELLQFAESLGTDMSDDTSHSGDMLVGHVLLQLVKRQEELEQIAKLLRDMDWCIGYDLYSNQLVDNAGLLEEARQLAFKVDRNRAKCKKLTCMTCNKTAEGFEEELFNEGWDFPGRFFSSPIVTCPDCPSAPLVIDWITDLQTEDGANE